MLIYDVILFGGRKKIDIRMWNCDFSEIKVSRTRNINNVIFKSEKGEKSKVHRLQKADFVSSKVFRL